MKSKIWQFLKCFIKASFLLITLIIIITCIVCETINISKEYPIIFITTIFLLTTLGIAIGIYKSDW